MADYKQVKIAQTATVSKHAVIVGDVTIGDHSTVFFFAALRGDDDKIVVGRCSNIQENCTIHCSAGNPTIIGDNVTVGHNAILHGCQIGDNTIVGMGSIIMDGSKIGKNCLIGAGSLIATNKEFPDNSLIFGNPARVKRPLTQEELDIIADSAVTCMNDGLEMTAQGVF